MKVLIAKLLSGTIIWIATMFFCLLPLIISKIVKQKSECDSKILALSMCFSGGVLLSSCFLHMLPEIFEAVYSNSTIEIDESGEHSHGLSIHGLILCFGFFLVYFLEETLTKYLGQNMSQEYMCEHSAIENQLGHGRTIDNNAEVSDYGAITRIEKTTKPHNSNLQLFKCILIIFALSFHSIFDGFAIGLQDTASQVLVMSVSIGIHKFLVSIVVGIDLFAHSNGFFILFLHILTFSIMTPIGIGISFIAKIHLESDISVYLSSMATGSLLYVTFYEILDTHKYKLDGFYQFLCTLIGFIFFACTQLIANLILS